MESNISLRETQPEHIARLFTFQNEPGACELAAYTAKPEDAFLAHWLQNLSRENTFVYTVFEGDTLVGSISFWLAGEHWEVGYWIGAQYQGRGIATKALSELLKIHHQRPIYAEVASHNKGSLIVLGKNGFIACSATKLDYQDGFVPGMQLILR